MSNLSAWAAYLRCPLCRCALKQAGGSLLCSRKHCFDLARQGYASLLTGPVPAGCETAAMVAAREAFLNKGHFEPLYAWLADLLTSWLPDTPRRIVDLGAGTGHLPAALLVRWPEHAGLALDLSKHACGRAARRHPRLAVLACDIGAEVPLRDACAGLVISSFAPRPAAEIQRILAPQGLLAVVTPAAGHAGELRRHLPLLAIEPDKLRRLDRRLSGCFSLILRQECIFQMRLDQDDIAAFVAMGPNAWHRQPLARERFPPLPAALPLSAELTLSLYRRRCEIDPDQALAWVES